jgi:uncharacterized protein (TIGR03083 family)
MPADPSIECLEETWASISSLLEGLSDDAWGLPTACPGWTVQDQLSHLVGPEALFLGRPQPAAPPPGAPRPAHVRNDLGARNEAEVDYRRPWPGAAVLEEFREVTALRLEQLRALDEEDLDEPSWTPTGEGTYRDLLAMRAFDAWVHEQDIREALGRPGHLEGAAARHALTSCFQAMPYVVARKAGAPEGSTVRFLVDGPTSGTLDVEVVGGRGLVATAGLSCPTATVAADFVTYTRVACGRADPASALAAGRIRLQGDLALGRAVAEALSFMP